MILPRREFISKIKIKQNADSDLNAQIMGLVHLFLEKKTSFCAIGEGGNKIGGFTRDQDDQDIMTTIINWACL